jgi:hypothetical protein
MAGSDALKKAFSIQHQATDALMAGVTKPGVIFTELRAFKRIDGDFHMGLRHGDDELSIILPPDDFKAFILNATRLLE